MATRTRRRYGATPSQRWMNIYRHGSCRICDKILNKGDRAFWDGTTSTLTCTDATCIEAAAIEGPRSRFGRCEDAPCCGCCS